jgi:hypothetical protein
VLDVGQRRAVEFDQFQQLEDALVDVEEGHVAAEAAGEAGGGDLELFCRDRRGIRRARSWRRFPCPVR